MIHLQRSSCRSFCALALLIATSAFAQDKPAAEGAGFAVAILNVDKVFQRNKPFTDQVAALRAEMEDLQKSASLKQSELEGVRAELQKAAPGTANFQKLQSQFGKLQQELQVFVQQGQQKIQQADIKNSLALHRQIADVLKTYCKAKGIRLVIRMQNSSLEDGQNPQQIMQALSRGVLYEDGLDITEDISKLIEQQSEKGKP